MAIMSPFARTLQILCLAIGLAFVITGLVTTDTRHHFLSLRQTWDCRPSGSGSSCTSDGDLENGTQRPITLGITGLGFLVASVSIAAGANRRTAPAPVAAPSAPVLPSTPWPQQQAAPGYPAGWPPQPGSAVGQ